MYKKSLATALVNLTTVSGLSALLTATTLVLSNPLLTNPASALPKDGPVDREIPTPRPLPKPFPRPSDSGKTPDYTGVPKFLVGNSSLLKQIVTTVWNEGGKGITEQKIKEALNGKQLQKGVSIYNANVNLGGISQQPIISISGADRATVTISIPGNNTEFKTTTNTIFGSYADPSFRVGFNLQLDIKVSALAQRIQVDDVTVSIVNANIHGSNATGTLVETFADFFTKGQFSRDILSRINGDYSVKNKLADYIQSAIGRYVPANILRL